MSRQWLLVSQYMGEYVDGQRHPLERVLLPLMSAPKVDYLRQGHVWWVERRGQRFFLRAKLYVTGISLDEERRSNPCNVICNIDPVRSERVSWSNGIEHRRSDISDILESLTKTKTSGLALTAVSDEIDQIIDRRRLLVSRRTSTYRDAKRITRLLFNREGIDLRPVDGSLTFEDAVKYVRINFAREELVTVDNFDAFDIAASVLLGLEEVSAGLGELPHEVKSSMMNPVIDSDNIDEQWLDFAEQEVTADVDLSTAFEGVPPDSRRHNSILRLLASRLVALGYSPTCNRHVDLRVVCRDDEVFFEVKAAGAGDFLEQVRRAVGQLLEYRFRYRRKAKRSIRLVAVVEAMAAPCYCDFARQFLAEECIGLVLWNPNSTRFEGLNELFI